MLSEAPWPHALIERFARIGDELLAITNQGAVYAASLATLHWQRILLGVDRVNAVAQDPA
jgi:hypothetical protein